MKVIKYKFHGCEKMFPWSEHGEEVAKKEAMGGEYTIEDISDEEAKAMGFRINTEPTDNDVLNALLGVS